MSIIHRNAHDGAQLAEHRQRPWIPVSPDDSASAPRSAPPPAPAPADGARATAAPSRSRRALGVDVARAIALIGMISVHVFSPVNASGDMVPAYAIFAGRASALFAVLAGVSIAFVERRSRGQLQGRTLAADRAALAVRGLLLLTAGLLLGFLDAPINTIIPYFGILFFMAVPLYGRSSRTLFTVAAVSVLVGPVLVHLYGPAILGPRVPDENYTLVSAARHPVQFLTDMLLTGQYPALLWIVYICIGMVIGRQVLTSTRTALLLAGWGTAVAAGTWALSSFLLGPAGGLERLVAATPALTRDDIIDQLAYGPEAAFMPNTTWWWLTAVSPYSHTPLDILHDLGSAVAVLGIVLLLTGKGGKVFTPFAAIGAMTLTLYSAHCTVLALEVIDEKRPMVSLWVQVVAFMLFALLWRSSLDKGPLEGIISDASDAVRRRVREPRAKPSPDTSAAEATPRPTTPDAAPEDHRS
jgi:uncharacterized membrane protein